MSGQPSSSSSTKNASKSVGGEKNSDSDSKFTEFSGFVYEIPVSEASASLQPDGDSHYSELEETETDDTARIVLPTLSDYDDYEDVDDDDKKDYDYMTNLYYAEIDKQLEKEKSQAEASKHSKNEFDDPAKKMTNDLEEAPSDLFQEQEHEKSEKHFNEKFERMDKQNNEIKSLLKSQIQAQRQNMVITNFPKWDGKPFNLETWLIMVEKKINQFPDAFESDQSRITLAICNGMTSPNSSTWINQIKSRKSSQFLENWIFFKQCLCEFFIDPCRAIRAEHDLQFIRQSDPLANILPFQNKWDLYVLQTGKNPNEFTQLYIESLHPRIFRRIETLQLRPRTFRGWQKAATEAYESLVEKEAWKLGDQARLGGRPFPIYL